MQKHIYLFLFTFFSFSAFAQNNSVGINTINPDTTAALDISSTTQGMLVPRMSSIQRSLINEPATGLLVFDISTSSFWFYSGSSWEDLSSAIPDKISDQDNDTEVEVDNGSDNDEIRFIVKDTEVGKMDGQTFHLRSPGGSLYIGEAAGVNDDGTNNNNIGIGAFALFADTSGSSNTAIGFESLRNNLSGYSNTSTGYNALRNNSHGISNTAFGKSAMLANINGAFNTAVGADALADNTSGRFNTAIGRASLQDNLDSLNVALGDLSGSFSSGSYNTFLGARAGQLNTGDYNILIGNNAGQNNIGSDKLYIDNSNTSFPLIYGEFDNNLLRVNGDLSIGGKYRFQSVGGSNGELLKYNNGVLEWEDDEINDADADPNNELQTLSYNGSSLSLSNGNSVPIAGGKWAEGSNEIYYNSGGQDVAIGRTSASARLHIQQENPEPVIKIDHIYSGSANLTSLSLDMPTSASGAKTGIYVQSVGGSSTSSNGIASYIIAGSGESHNAIYGSVSGSATAIRGVSFDSGGKAANFNGTTEIHGRTYLDGDVGIGTETPISNFQVHDPNSSLSKMYITPASISSEDSSMIFFAEDDEATFGMFWQYDGVGNNMELFGTANGTVYGPHLSADRNSGIISLKDNTIVFNPNVGGAGRITTDEIEITGGSDLAEYFNSSLHNTQEFMPGTIVCVDGDNGEIIPSNLARDTKVIGVVSGANGVKTGMFLGQKGTLANGDIPVAITGRVYVKMSNENGEIYPGDFVTTSSITGKAMKVENMDLAKGAILGKALTKEKDGFVLVLIGLQ